ncbi:TPA: type II toxin-antitoxin system Phd/YefM family antitoxin [Candidatus Poribacteria bacterium]|nr:type II toxin-antitoxin system Phd/YefM family antitoxin [Candidatus Poribacteria bacterium]HEX28906.1 type II toxin-antitoxin system Phd/YefM family antitoxin [Candidatus Poribacteria bacterium]
MRHIISTIDLRAQMGEILNRAFYNGDEFLITRKGKPLAVIIPYSEYGKWLKLREKLFEKISEVQDRFDDLCQEKVDRIALEAVRWARGNDKGCS